ncbi:MAG: ABC transporter permease [Vicinamibacteria bacterium]
MRTWLNRQRFLADYALSSLARRRARAALLVFVYAAVVALVASVMLYADSVRREASLVLRDSPAVLVQRTQAGRFAPVPAAYVDALAGLRGVQAVEGRLWGYYYDPVIRATLTVMVPPARSGRAVERGRVRVGAAVARARRLRAGDRLALVTTGGVEGPASDGKSTFSGVARVMLFGVSEVLPEESEGLTADVLLLSAEDFRSLVHHPEGFFTDIALDVANPAEHRTVARKASARLGDVRTILREDVARTYASVFGWREGLVLVVLAGVVGAFALFAFDRASGLSAEEAREIAILKAVGWDAGDVMRMKAWEGAVLSAAAFGLGYLAAYLFVFHVPADPLGAALRGWTALRPRVAPTPAPDAFRVATLFVLTVLPYTAAVLVPVWRAAVAEPDSVIRG